MHLRADTDAGDAGWFQQLLSLTWSNSSQGGAAGLNGIHESCFEERCREVKVCSVIIDRDCGKLQAGSPSHCNTERKHARLQMWSQHIYKSCVYEWITHSSLTNLKPEPSNHSLGQKMVPVLPVWEWDEGKNKQSVCVSVSLQFIYRNHRTAHSQPMMQRQRTTSWTLADAARFMMNVLTRF